MPIERTQVVLVLMAALVIVMPFLSVHVSVPEKGRIFVQVTTR